MTRLGIYFLFFLYFLFLISLYNFFCQTGLMKKLLPFSPEKKKKMGHILATSQGDKTDVLRVA